MKSSSSHFDNAPVTLIEAAAMGLAIITTNAGGIPDLFENNQTAMLVDDNDSEGMADAIISLVIDNIQFEKLRKNAFELSRKFDEDSVLQKWIETLKEE